MEDSKHKPPFTDFPEIDMSPDLDSISKISLNKNKHEESFVHELLASIKEVTDGFQDVSIRGKAFIGERFDEEPAYSTQEMVNYIRRQLLRDFEIAGFINDLNYSIQEDPISGVSFQEATFVYVPSVLEARLMSEEAKVLARGKRKDLQKILTAKKRKSKFPLKLYRGTRWEDFILRFKDDRTLEIFLGSEKRHEADFIEMGFKDRRKELPTPNKQWNLLQILAGNNGVLTWEDERANATLKKTKQLLSAELERYFGLRDPFEAYDKKNGYKAKFALFPIEGTSNETKTQRAETESYFDQAMEEF